MNERVLEELRILYHKYDYDMCMSFEEFSAIYYGSVEAAMVKRHEI